MTTVIHTCPFWLALDDFIIHLNKLAVSLRETVNKNDKKK